MCHLLVEIRKRIKEIEQQDLKQSRIIDREGKEKCENLAPNSMA
jgi:hypothetical protein